MKNKHLLLTLLLALFVPWAANAQTVTIGTGTSTQNMSPVANYYNYSFTEMIYTASEIAAGTPTEDYILNVGFQLAANGLNGKTYSISIYMKNIDDDQFESAAFMAVSSGDLVYEGTMSATASGWVTLTLDTPFHYDNQKNLLIAINKTAGSYAGNAYNWNYTSTSSSSLYQHVYKQNDSDGAYSITNLPSSATRNYNRPNVQLTFGAPPTCFAPQNLMCTGYTSTTATLTWQRHNLGTENAWVLQYSMDNTFATGVQSVNVSDTPSTQLTDLTAETKYYARVRPDCDENLWSDVCEFKPTNAISQTVCDGTTTNGYVPVYGNYAENYNKDEFIIPATTEGMAGMADGTISKMTFYLSTPASDLWGAALYRVFMKEVNESSFASTSYYGTDGATIVYEGALDGTQSTMTIEFTTDYEYNGGNLLVGIYEYNKGSYKNCSFYGITSTNGALYKNNGTSLESITSGTLQNFIPKTTFTYLPCTTPKPKNLHVVDGSLNPTGATLAWDAPATATPTSYQYQYKEGEGEWTALESTTELSVALSLSASKTYTFQVRAAYEGVGESDFVETTFTTLDDCAFPTNLLAYTTPGQGTKATLNWVKGYDEENWVLQYGTDPNFTDGTYTEKTSGFIPQTEPGLENVVAAVLTDLTAETHYYARVMANCGDATSVPSNVADFTPTNYVDYTFGQAATYTSYFVPIYGSYVGSSPLLSQFIIPSSELEDMAGGTIRRMTFHSSTASANWGTAEFSVYVKEVDATSFASSSASGLEDWSSMTNVYNGSLSISGNQMVIEFENNFAYNGGNLMIGFNETTTGTGASASWYYVSGPSNSTLYAYYYYGASYSRGSYLPKVTFNYRPTTTPRPIITEPVATTDVTATIAWTKPSDNVTGYKYQYKLASATEWPTSWTDLNDANAVSVTVPGLTPNTEYNFQMKAVYGTEESYPSTTSFATSCPATTAVPYTYDFETAPKFNCWEVATGSSVTRVNASSYAHNSDWYMKFGGYQTNEIAMPSFNQPANTLRLEYWVRPESYSNSSCGSFAIGYYNANNEFVALKTYAYNSTTSKYDGWESDTYKKEVIDFDVDANNDGTPDVPADANIVFRQFNTTSNWFWFVDDVKVKVIPTCEDVDNVHCVSFTNHSATIAWTADAVQDAWQIAYKAGANNFNPNNAEELATATIVDATTNPYLFDKNLEAGTTYYMYVRGNCGNVNGLGDWSDTYATFTTKAATPAPSNFVATNPASEKIDLVWTAGGGDFESWEIYYVASETTPEAPTATTTATVTDITTLPTTEAPYVLDELYPVTKYYAWIRAKHVWNSETTYSDWVALTSSFFETLDACPTPYDLEIANITSVSADFSWTGSTDVEDYVVEYAVEGTYSVNETEDFSGLTTAGYSAEGVLPEGWKRYNSNPGYMPHVSDASACGDINEFGTGNNYLLMTQNKKNSDQYLYAIMPQINNLVSFEFKYVYESTSYGVLSVGYVTNNTDYSTYQVLQTPTKSGTIATCKLTADNIATINANNGYVTFRYEGNYDTYYSVGIDDIVYKGGTYTPNPATQVEVDNAVQTTINGLTANTNYVARVKSVCTNAEWSSYINFTTLTEGKIVFTNASGDGLWSTAANWTPNAPAISDTAILRANAIIPNGTVATAKKITFEGATTPTLTINDGGQLQTDNTVTATVKKNITGYGTGLNAEGNPSGYYLIANPLNSSVYPSTTNGLVTTPAENYDLYQWSTSTSATYDEWRNFKASSFYLYNGTGYLYANVADVDLTFTGTVKANNTDAPMSLSFSTGGEFNGWNLKANPFVCNAYVKDATNGIAAFYRMNTAGDNFEAATGAIKPMEGIFVQATDESQSFKFTRTATSAAPGNLNINLAQAVTTRGEKGATDNAIIRFGEGNTLEKFSFRANSSKVYIPVEGKDYAVVNAGKTGEIPVSFKAEKNGSYSLSFTSQEVSFSYLHLIDNLTGNDVDLLANPSYSFDAQTTDYANRFKLVFATGSSVDGDSFAFINGMGNLSIFGIEGTATVQVMDVLGHVLSSETFSGSYEKKLNVAPGVYMIRLINGNDVKVQKMIVK